MNRNQKIAIGLLYEGNTSKDKFEKIINNKPFDEVREEARILLNEFINNYEQAKINHNIRRDYFEICKSFKKYLYEYLDGDDIINFVLNGTETTKYCVGRILSDSNGYNCSLLHKLSKSKQCNWINKAVDIYINLMKSYEGCDIYDVKTLENQSNIYLGFSEVEANRLAYKHEEETVIYKNGKVFKKYTYTRNSSSESYLDKELNKRYWDDMYLNSGRGYSEWDSWRGMCGRK